MPLPFVTTQIAVLSDGSVQVVAVAPPIVVTPTPTPPIVTDPPVGGIPLAPGFNWTSLKADTAYVLSDGEYVGPGKAKLPSGVTLAALHAGAVVIKGKKDQPNLWGTDGNVDYSVNLTLVDLIFEGGGFSVGNHQAAVRTNDGWKLIRTTHRKSGGVGVNIEGHGVSSIGLVAEDNAASGRGGKVTGYTEIDATTRRNNIIANDGNGSSKFSKSGDVTIIGLHSYENVGAGLWLDGNRGNFVIRDSQFYDNRTGNDDPSRGRGLYVEYQLSGTVLVENNLFHGNEGAGADVAESADVTIRLNSFLPGKEGSPFQFVALQLRDIGRDYEDGRKGVQDILQRLVFVSNTLTYPLRVQRDKASQDIRIGRNTLTFGVNSWLNADGTSGSPQIDIPAA